MSITIEQQKEAAAAMSVEIDQLKEMNGTLDAKIDAMEKGVEVANNAMNATEEKYNLMQDYLAQVTELDKKEKDKA